MRTQVLAKQRIKQTQKGILGISLSHLPHFHSLYTKLAIDSNTSTMLPLAKKLGRAAWTGIPNLSLCGGLRERWET